MQTDMSVGLLP